MHIRIFVTSNLQFTLVPRFHGWTFLPKPDRVAVSPKNMRTLINSQRHAVRQNLPNPRLRF